MSSASTTSTRFIAPYVAQMSADGSANYVYVQQETVAIAGIDYEFDVTLDASGAADLLNSFTVSGKGVDATLNVTLSDSAKFQAVLASVVNGAYEAAKSGKTATTQLQTDLHNGLLSAIYSDALINTVENVDFTNVYVTIDSAGGASDMATNMNDERCRLIYTQLPLSSADPHATAYIDASENPTTSALPLLGGDILSFVFDVDLQDVTPAKSQTDINTSADPAAVTTGQVSGAYVSGIHFNLPSKRIAFNVAMPGTAGAALDGLKA